MRVDGEQRRQLLAYSSRLEGQHVEDLYGAEPPLVTEHTIKEAENMHVGAPIYGVHPEPAR